MVIDAKLPPEDSAPLPAPPPAYAPPSGVSTGPSSHPPPHQFQQYPPSPGQNYSGSPGSLPQYNAPVTGSQPIPQDEWVGHQYRNQRKSSSRHSHFPDHNIMCFQFSLNVRGVTMTRLQASVFVASFAPYFYFPLGSSFFGTQ
jgi:hypothetical protein